MGGCKDRRLGKVQLEPLNSRVPLSKSVSNRTGAVAFACSVEKAHVWTLDEWCAETRPAKRWLANDIGCN